MSLEAKHNQDRLTRRGRNAYGLWAATVVNLSVGLGLLLFAWGGFGLVGFGAAAGWLPALAGAGLIAFNGLLLAGALRRAPDAEAVESQDDAMRANAMRALERERDEAVAASKAKSEFLAAMSHELRTPLNAIIGFSDLMKQRLFGPMPARYAEYADLIHESGRHLLDLIGDVLDMSKIEADRYELVEEGFDAREVAETCAKLVRLRAEDKGLALSLDLGETPLEVSADRKALRQILLNLLSNAIKFTPEGGVVGVMARASGDELILAVGDSGTGIAPEDIDRLGSPYRQSASGLDSEERGTGLGLSLVSALSRMHGGAMRIDSELGVGTTVTVRLPVMTSATVEPLAREGLDVRDQIRLAQSAGESLSRDGADENRSAGTGPKAREA